MLFPCTLNTSVLETCSYLNSHQVTLFNLTFPLSYMKIALRTNHRDALNSLSGGSEGVSNLTPFPLMVFLPLLPRPSPKGLERPSAAPPHPPPRAHQGQEALTLAKKSTCLITELIRPPGVQTCKSYF